MNRSSSRSRHSEDADSSSLSLALRQSSASLTDSSGSFRRMREEESVSTSKSGGTPKPQGSLSVTDGLVERIKENVDSAATDSSRVKPGSLKSTSAAVQRIKSKAENTDRLQPGSLESTAARVQRITSKVKSSTGPTVGGLQTDEPSLQRRSEDSHRAGETQVPDSVRDVISSPGHSLDGQIQQVMEERMDDSFGDVRIHTGPQAARACDAINARAFTVGNHIAFNAGEYDPSSADGKFLLAHELTHVRQQSGGAALSMMPMPNADLEIDPDPQLEREADEAATEALSGEGAVTVNRMGADVHIQRVKKYGRGESPYCG